MKTIEVKRKDLNIREWIKRSAKESDYDTLIDEPCILVEDGEIKVVYDHLGNDIDTTAVVNALHKIKYQKGKRSRGLVSNSRVFGYKPRNEMRQDYCSTTSLADEAPREHDIVAGLALKLEEYYKKYNPEGYEEHRKESEGKIKDHWRIGKNSLFTSGIINKNNPLKYHHDTGNFSKVYSMMIVFKGGIEGGYLSLPEYGVAFKLPNNSLFMFDGQGLLHGVTPIKMQSPMSYRYSVVYYTLKRMWQCLMPTEELARIQESRTRKERLRMETGLTPDEEAEKARKQAALRARIGKQ